MYWLHCVCTGKWPSENPGTSGLGRERTNIYEIHALKMAQLFKILSVLYYGSLGTKATTISPKPVISVSGM